MNYLIEGPRKVGKTFLINSLLNKNPKFKVFKTEILEAFSFFKNPYIFFGKDLSLLSLIRSGNFDNLLFDRGFISTLVYGEFFNRYTKEEVDYFIGYINDYLPNLKIILIKGDNKKERKKDSFDFLDNSYSEQLDLFKKYLDKIDCSFEIIDNQFDKKTEENFIKLFGGENR
jgi:AAA+ ATPase superfamily predicted ATPase